LLFYQLFIIVSNIAVMNLNDYKDDARHESSAFVDMLYKSMKVNRQKQVFVLHHFYKMVEPVLWV
jgi:hypothetical protein